MTVQLHEALMRQWAIVPPPAVALARIAAWLGAFTPSDSPLRSSASGSDELELLMQSMPQRDPIQILTTEEYLARKRTLQ